MDAARFDRLTKGLSAPRSRRGVLLGTLAGTLGGVLALLAPETTPAARGTHARRRRHRGSAVRAQVKPDKIGVCHLTGSETNPVVFIEVSEKARKAHEAHGDAVGV